MSSTQKHYRAVLAEARPLAAACGLTVHLEHGSGRHPTRLVIEGRGKRWTLPLACSPSDRDTFVRRKTRDVERLCQTIYT
jgi:hypothetical protein